MRPGSTKYNLPIILFLASIVAGLYSFSSWDFVQNNSLPTIVKTELVEQSGHESDQHQISFFDNGKSSHCSFQAISFGLSEVYMLLSYHRKEYSQFDAYEKTLLLKEITPSRILLKIIPEDPSDSSVPSFMG